MYAKKMLSVLMLTALTAGGMAIAAPTSSFAKGRSHAGKKVVVHNRKKDPKKPVVKTGFDDRKAPKRRKRNPVKPKPAPIPAPAPVTNGS